MSLDPINDILTYLALYVVEGLFDQPQAKVVLKDEITKHFNSLDKQGRIDTLSEWDCSSLSELLSATTSDLSSRFID